MRVYRSSIAISVFVLSFLFVAHSATAQDSPGRFEAGANLTALHSRSLPAGVGPAIDGDINFGRHIALDGSFNWLPARPAQTFSGFFGAKVGTRTEHFGFFGKVRPGFYTFTNSPRSTTVNLDTFQATLRRARQTQKGLDLGGVFEYYPAKHWAFRWDMGDTLMFEERSFTSTIIAGGVTSSTLFRRPLTSHHFVFSSGVHYRF